MLRTTSDTEWSHENFTKVVNIFDFVRNECTKIDKIKGTDEAVLVTGSTGNGKSTLLNYLKGVKLLVNDDGGMKCE